MSEESKVRRLAQKMDTINGNLVYAARYSNGNVEYTGFASKAEAENYLDNKKDIETIKENTPYQPSIPVSQTVDSAANKPTEEVNTPPQPTKDRIINVVKDYDWTYSKNKIKIWTEVPYVFVQEFKLAGNSYLSSLMSSALLFPDVLDSSAAAVNNAVGPKFFEKLKKDFSKNEFGKFMGAIGDNANQVTEKLQKNVENFGNRITDQVKNIDKTAEEWKSITGDDDLYRKYAYLYIREKTGLNYKFPYFEKGYINISNEFNDTYSNANELQKMAAGFSELIEKTAGMLNLASITEPGMFIQRPKFFNFANSEFSVDVNFYLFNTISPNAFIKNLDLITKLLIRNTPYRHNRILVDPPAIYQLTVPGRGFYPYTFISKFEVAHEGTKRIIQINGKDTIIPDAFKISINFKSLTNEVNNFIIPQMGSASITVGNRGSESTQTRQTTQVGFLEKVWGVLTK